METKIIVMDVFLLDNAGTLKAKVDFKIGRSKFYSWRIIQIEGKDPFVNAPQESWEKDGKKKYKTLIQFEGKLQKQINEAILTAYNEALKE